MSHLLSVIIPAYNEVKTIEEVIRRVDGVPFPKEIIVVDDGSTDGTRELVEQKLKPQFPNLKFIKHEKNQGKGAGIRTGIHAVEGDMVIIQDADLEYKPEEYMTLIQPIVDGKASVVYGSRFTTVNRWLFMWHWFLNHFFGRKYEIRYLHHFLGIQVLNGLANVLYSAKITDEATCYKLFKTEVLRKVNLRCTGFEFCPEVTAKVRKLGFSIFEVPIEYHPRSKNEGKKLNWTDGFKHIWVLVKYRFVD